MGEICKKIVVWFFVLDIHYIDFIDSNPCTTSVVIYGMLSYQVKFRVAG